MGFDKNVGQDAPRSITEFYDTAFSRNRGWVTDQEFNQLAGKTVAIAGMGGVGGSHLITLARLGIGKFRIADFDIFEIQNFNRQYGADMSTVNRKKLDVMREKLLLINPHAEVQCFPEGITADNMNAFLKGVDLFVDGLDVFEIGVRRKVFKKAYELGIPSVSVAPLGMGASQMIFLPGKMSCEEYCGFVDTENSELENLCRFLLGMSPSLLHISTIADRSYANLIQKKAPSTPMGCMLASGVLGTQALKILLKREGVFGAPHGVHFDSYKGKVRRTWVPFGARNWIFRLKLKIFMHMVKKADAEARAKPKLA